MMTYEERTERLMEKVEERKRKRRRVFIASASSAMTCLVVLTVCLALLLPAAGGGSGQTTDNAHEASLEQGAQQAAAESPYRNVLDAYDAKAHIDDSSGVEVSDYSIHFDGALDSSQTSVESSYYNLSSSSSSFYSPAISSSGDVSSSKGDGEAYIENSNVQVPNIKEGDILKESTHYFYRLSVKVTDEDIELYPSGIKKNTYRRRLQLDVFRKAGLQTVCNGSCVFLPFGMNVSTLYSYNMYLSDDCRTAYVVVSDSISRTAVVMLDLTDLDDIHVNNTKFVCGEHTSSRLAGDKLLVFTSYSVSRNHLEDPATYVPYVEGEEKTLIAPDAIVCPFKVNDYYYSVMTAFGEDLSLIGQCAVLKGGTRPTVYVSDRRAYIAYGWSVTSDKMGALTYITCIDYSGDTLRLEGTFVVEGQVTNQYWMDEHEGVLRVASTVVDYVWAADESRILSRRANANLTCFAVGTWEVLGKVTRFAPDGESVRSVRYTGDKAYICTAKVTVTRIVDPVYCFDLTDYAHITSVDTGTITGFSGYLVPFADDTMLGIGKETADDVKLELYRETDTDVESLCTLILGGEEVYDEKGSYLKKTYSLYTEYKGFLLNADEGLVGIPCRYSCMNIAWSEEKGKLAYTNEGSVGEYVYVICSYTDGQLRVAEILSPGGQAYSFRAAIADGYVYVFGESSLQVLTLCDLH